VLAQRSYSEQSACYDKSTAGHPNNQRLPVLTLSCCPAVCPLVLAPQAAVTGGAIARQERSVHEAARTAAILLHNRLNGRNMVPGLSFIDLPFSLSMTLIDILLPLGLITPGGQPVLRQQGHQPFRASADSFRKMEATFVGRWDEVFGSDDMICIPDPFPWLNADDFAQLSGFDTALMSHMISLKQRSVQHLITIVDGLIPTSFTCTASNSIILWAAQLIDKFATAFCDNSKDSNIALTTAASCNTWVCKAGRGSGPRVSGDGGSGSGVCLTAVGGGDEGEQVGQGDSCVPVIRAGMRDEEASRVSMVGRIKRVARSMGSMVGCFVCRCF